MTLTEYLTQVKSRLEKATPGPWHTLQHPWFGSNDLGIIAGDPDPHKGFFLADLNTFDDHPDIEETENRQSSNAKLIASAPTDLAKLIKVVEVMRKCLLDYSDHEQSGKMTHYWAEHTLKEAERLVRGD